MKNTVNNVTCGLLLFAVGALGTPTAFAEESAFSTYRQEVLPVPPGTDEVSAVAANHKLEIMALGWTDENDDAPELWLWLPEAAYSLSAGWHFLNQLEGPPGEQMLALSNDGLSIATSSMPALSEEMEEIPLRLRSAEPTPLDLEFFSTQALTVHDVEAGRCCGWTSNGDPDNELYSGFIADSDGIVFISGEDERSIFLSSVNATGIATGMRSWAEDDGEGGLEYKREAILATTSEVVPLSSLADGSFDNAIFIGNDDTVIATKGGPGGSRVCILRSKVLDRNNDGVISITDFADYAYKFAMEDDEADVDKNGTVNSDDLTKFAGKFAVAESVEPATGWQDALPFALATRGSVELGQWPPGLLEACASDALFIGLEAIAEGFLNVIEPDGIPESNEEDESDEESEGGDDDTDIDVVGFPCDFVTDEGLGDCCSTFCEAFPDCCSVDWDEACSFQFQNICGVRLRSPDCSRWPDGIRNNPQELRCCESFCDVYPDCCSIQSWDDTCEHAARNFCGPIIPNPGEYNPEESVCGAKRQGELQFVIPCFNWACYMHDECWEECRPRRECDYEMYHRMIEACKEDRLRPPGYRRCWVQGQTPWGSESCETHARFIVSVLKKDVFCEHCPSYIECQEWQPPGSREMYPYNRPRY